MIKEVIMKQAAFRDVIAMYTGLNPITTVKDVFYADCPECGREVQVTPIPTPNPEGTSGPSTPQGKVSESLPSTKSGSHIQEGFHHTADTSATADRKSDTSDKP